LRLTNLTATNSVTTPVWRKHTFRRCGVKAYL